jgi:nucleotide-binding universal stress UspA family protein
MTRIVVGVDGSAGSVTAMRWAAEQARRHEAELEVVYVYDDTPAYELYEYPMGLRSEAGETTHERASQHAKELVESMVTQLGDLAGLDIEALTVRDRRPARALLERARDADLLVVGSRGRGGFTGLVLGSVSQQCAHHATCPLTIVPDTDSSAEAA